MPRRTVSALAASLLLLVALVGPASAFPAQAETWHRLNPFTDAGVPEHEQLHCLTRNQWVCRYDKQPEPALDFSWDRTQGTLQGREVDLTAWECAEWMPTELCEGATLVVAGTITFQNADGSAFRVEQELIFTDGSNGLAPLYVHWVSFGFACAWYGSLDEAMAADPLMEGNCIFA